MTQNRNSENRLVVLRRDAESALAKKAGHASDLSALPPEELQNVVHELQVHQIELEMQNEELRQTQLELAGSRDNFSELYDFAPVGYVTLNEKGFILEANLTAVRLLGEERQRLIQMPFSRFVREEFGDAFYLYLRKVFETQSKQTSEIKLARKDGTHFYAQLESVTVQHESGQFNRCRTIVSDITDRKRAEELALEAARLRSIADLSSGVSHHFNNLLQIVMGIASLSLMDLESGNGDLSTVRTNLEKMLQAASLGADTVRRLQIFANACAAVTERDSVVFDIAATVRNIVEVSKPFWKTEPEKKGIKVDMHMDLEAGCLLKGQENEMFEVLLNLTKNAVEALPEGGDIDIEAGKEADEVVISVRDTGVGIAETNLPRVFQPFWSTNGLGIGKGMGLAVTHGLVKRHGGTISVQSKVGAGTTFTIRLPLAQRAPATPEQAEGRTADGRLNILLIDDESDIATLLGSILAESGHTVFEALSGEDGLDIFKKESVDLVICDLGMPGMNGWEVGKAIRSICRDKGITKPSFILLTGWGGQELERERIAESGTDAVVSKPIDSAALLSAVQDVAPRFK